MKTTRYKGPTNQNKGMEEKMMMINKCDKCEEPIKKIYGIFDGLHGLTLDAKCKNRTKKQLERELIC